MAENIMRVGELPPRARRIRFMVGTRGGVFVNYLRVRGEYGGMGSVGAATEELPPRARRIPRTMKLPCSRYGTTSACAENTIHPIQALLQRGNYLRVRGEYPCLAGRLMTSRELPPRARRIPQQGGERPIAPGTTSACAENTSTTVRKKWFPRNYLRVRGEYPK